MKPIRSFVAALLLSIVLGAQAVSGELSFEPVPPATTDEQRSTYRATTAVTIDGKQIPISFQPMMATGDRIGGGTFGQLTDWQNRPITTDGKPSISVYPDYSSILRSGGRLWAVTHMEALPSSLYLTRLKQNRSTGQITALDTRALRLGHMGGIYNPCAGMISPWGTHIGGEEYPPDARAFAQSVAAADPKQLGRWIPRKLPYFGIDPQKPDFEQIKARFKPYQYGFAFEVNVKGWLNVGVSRHYAMGRFSHELAYVMPDRRTVYMSDDGDNTGFFLFHADRAGDLTSGRLFAARWEQTSAPGSIDGTAKITWIDLGAAQSRPIARAIEEGITFDALFETAEMSGDGQCPATFGAVNFVGDLAKQAGECLKVRPGKDMLASRLETRRYAALKGATTEFSKAEGITYDPKRQRLMLSITSVARGMENRADRGKSSDSFDRGGPNHIQLAYNPCGAVFGLDLGRDDTVGSQYVARSMTPLLSGRYNAAVPPTDANSCMGIAGPDNVTFIPEHDTLIIAEDTGGWRHNDSIWAYDVGREKLTRIMQMPPGAEASGIYWYPNINGFDYLSAVIQHPYAEGSKITTQPPTDDPRHRASVVGFIGPMPTSKRERQ